MFDEANKQLFQAFSTIAWECQKKSIEFVDLYYYAYPDTPADSYPTFKVQKFLEPREVKEILTRWNNHRLNWAYDLIRKGLTIKQIDNEMNKI